MDNIKTINDLLNCNFFIPSYQRGYRWTQQQVTDLLNDVWEFMSRKDKKDNEWYCIQPVVVVKTNDDTKNKNCLIGDWYDVIDGQQRLTTTFLILKFLGFDVENGRKNFQIKYETRKDSESFLTDIKNKSEADSYENVDFYHIFQSFQAIKKWFENNKDVDEEIFSKTFLKKVNAIWYETIDSNSIDIFTRINSGKIPLTNAELIKALFLNSSNFKNADKIKLGLIQREISSEWDRIEYALQDDSFWYFINKDENNLATRIEFIFNLMYLTAQIEDEEVEERKRLKIKTKEEIENRQITNPTVSEKFGDDEYSTFRFFSHKFKKNSREEVENNWKEIKKYFQTIEEWYNERELYHKIGYLIAIGIDIKVILIEKKGKSKREFASCIAEQIKNDIKCKKAIEELEYVADNSHIKKILLLHNVITTLKSEDTTLRFPFDKYKNKKNGGWSLEHIHAQNSEDIKEIIDFDEWLKVVDEKEFSDNLILKKKLIDYNRNKQKEKIPQLVKEISETFGELDIHSIDNLALLSKNDNSKLNNGLFPLKRERIIEIEKNGGFIPITTKKVFQKYYEGCTKQLSKWENADREAYLIDIKNTLENI